MTTHIGCGEDITTNTTMAVMEIQKEEPYKRKNCWGDTTDASTAIQVKKKRPYTRANCADTTNMSSVMEMRKKKVCKRKDCGDTAASSTSVTKKRENCASDSTDTSTVTEIKKKGSYRRKDCADTADTSTSVMKKRKNCVSDTTDTSTVTEIKKKRAYKRKDCGDTADTSAVMKNMKDCGSDTTDKSTVMEIKKKRPYRRKKYLPHDLIVEQILTRLPVPTLLEAVLVSKLWYNSIHNDHKRLTYSHFLQSQKQPDIVFSLLNVRDAVVEKTGEPSYACHLFKFRTGYMYRKVENVLEFHQLRGGFVDRDILEMVGYCNGLPCMALVRLHSTAYLIMDPNRKDFLYIFCPARVGRGISQTRIICHGFGFDPSANKYKLVSIFRTPQKELNFLVFTLGAKSWRDVTARSMPILGHCGRPIIKIRAPTGSDKSAIFCKSSSKTSGCLAWKIIATLGGAGFNDAQHDNSNDTNNEMEMLLLFNLHDEKFQLIQLPAKSTTNEQQKHLLVNYPHLLGFKGSPCIARIEKISGNGSDYPHRCRDDHQGSSGGSCCCCCKVHLYVLKDNVNQVWVKEESFDVRINSTPNWLGNVGYLAPDPCCFCSGGTTTPPIRIFSFSDQVFLYWFNRKYLQVYNLRSEKLQLILPVHPREDVVFRAKMKEPRHISVAGTDDDIYCPSMDYQLHCHEENFLSLQTFIPEGVEGVDGDDFGVSHLKRDNRTCTAYVSIYRGSKVCYPIYN